MIYTVTLNPAVDKTVTIENFKPGEVNRVQRLRRDPGGKGINVSKVIASLDGKSVAMGILAGQSGQWIEEAVQCQGIATDFCYVAGETRTNLKIVDEVRGENTDINEPGTEVTDKDLERVLQHLLQSVQPGDMVILAGSLPKGAPESLYGSWVEALHGKGVKVCLDADGEALKLGVDATPFFIKPNEKEMEVLLRDSTRMQAIEESEPKTETRMEEMLELQQNPILKLAEAGRKLNDRGIPWVVISLGEAGALFCHEGKVTRGYGIKVPVGSTVGAGDSVVAAFAYGLEQGMAEEEMLKLALATSAANVMCSGSQPARRAQIEALLSKAILAEV